MDVEQSMQSRRVNYMNRPAAFKRNARSENIGNPFKQQRLYNTQLQEDLDEEIAESDNNNTEDSEINFMSEASLQAYHI